VGDVAGMGADLYESYVDSIVATMALAAAAGLGLKGVITPMLMAACGVVASVIGFFMVQTKKEGQRDLIFALRRGVITAAVLITIFSYFVVIGVLGKGYLGVWGCVVCGLVAGIFLGFTTEYFTSHSFQQFQPLFLYVLQS
jgi:K(+)-stimulated pyrophosphate-energized sodium pump